MSKKNNVNPDYYKVRGRDRVNEDVVPGKIAPSARRDIESAAKAAERARERQATEEAEKQLDREQKP